MDWLFRIAVFAALLTGLTGRYGLGMPLASSVTLGLISAQMAVFFGGFIVVMREKWSARRLKAS